MMHGKLHDVPQLGKKKGQPNSQPNLPCDYLPAPNGGRPRNGHSGTSTRTHKTEQYAHGEKMRS